MKPGQAQQQVQRGLEQAMANLATKEARIQRDLDVAQTLADLAGKLQESRDEIARQAAALEQAQLEPTEKNPHALQEAAQAASALGEASQEFADAQRATGQGAAEISEQETIANAEIREALQAASELGWTGEQPAEAATQPAGESSPAGEPSAAQSGQPSSAQPGSQAAASEQALGDGVVPNAPEVTAQQIAGPEAMQAAAQAQAQAQAQASQQASSSSSQSASQQPSESAQNAQAQVANQGNATAQASESAQADSEDGALTLQRTGQGDSRMATEEHDAEATARRFQQEPWFAKLPDSLRKAILSRTRRNAPRGYEERLKRYFESND